MVQAINFKSENAVKFNNPKSPKITYADLTMPDDELLIEDFNLKKQEKREKSRDNWNKVGVCASVGIAVALLAGVIARIFIAKGLAKSGAGGMDPNKFDLSKLDFLNLSKEEGIADIKTTKTLTDDVKKFFVELLDSTKFEEKYIKRAGLLKEGYPNASLLLGPVGTGKTEAVKMYAKASGGDLAIIKLGDFANSYVDGTATSMLNMFKAIKEKAEKEPDKTITVLFDEVDGLARKLEKIDSHNNHLGQNRQSFITGLDMIKPYKNIRIFATTNVPLDEIDKAVVSRLSRNVTFEIPKVDQSFEGLKFHLRDCEGCKDDKFDFFKDKESEIKAFLKKLYDKKGAYRDLRDVAHTARAKYLIDMQNSKDISKKFSVKYLEEALKEKGKLANEIENKKDNNSFDFRNVWSKLNIWQKLLVLFNK